jgi:spermidine/putrescine-binding protein
MPSVAAFNSDNPANPYMEGEVNLGMVWNVSADVARQAGTARWRPSRRKKAASSGWTPALPRCLWFQINVAAR